MKSVIFFFLSGLMVLSAKDHFEAARAALDAGFPKVALLKIEEAMPMIGNAGAGDEANLLYARALIADGQSEVAVKLLGAVSSNAGLAKEFWLAQAFAANGDSTEALEKYTNCAMTPDFLFFREAVLGRASMLRNLNRLDEAVSVLAVAASWPSAPEKNQALLDLAELHILKGNGAEAQKVLLALRVEDLKDQTKKDFLSAAAMCLLNENESALEILANLKPHDPNMLTSNVVLQAQALSRTGKSAEAESLLEDFIAGHPGILGLERVFVALDGVYAAAPNASSSEMKRWSEEKDATPRRKLATYYLARLEARQGATKEAATLLEALAADPASNPLSSETTLELAVLRVRLGQPTEALALLPEPGTSPYTDFLRGIAQEELGNHSLAASAFVLAAANPEMAEGALFNAAICELKAGNTANLALAELEKKYPSSERIPAFHLQEAFSLARNADPKATEILAKLAESAPADIAGRARLALAEWEYQQIDYPAAALQLQRISSKGESPREAALGVFLADSGEPDAMPKAIEAARAFLARFPDSEPEPSVRMKLGELLFLNGDYASARVELESLARKFPGSDFEVSALFLAAQAVSRIPESAATADAMLLFEEVAARGGAFSSRARLEQAAILTSQGKPLEANLVIDKVLSSSPDLAMKATALIEKGKNFYTLGSQDPANYKSAMDVWKQVASEEFSDPAWRNQALTRIGTALEKSGDDNAAVASYYEVFKPTPVPSAEFFWFYKAGFAAGRIFEVQQKWSEAIRVYEIMAANEGPRALEAKKRIQQIRLEHFIWDGE